MTESFRVTCPTPGDVPPAHQFRAWTTGDRHVVLRIPRGSLAGLTNTKESIVARLAAALPSFSVADSGGDRTHEFVTVTRPGGRPEGIGGPGARTRGQAVQPA
ncbi:MAG TPA: hypothetical protein VH092_16905 [Urbifossiella sp.]|jgi:hypothetical protein|nr:hypothetical protein [Urbifossiella sp.]